jgi:outer membrane protein OmpA-like peptidoglycan-associated protein
MIRAIEEQKLSSITLVGHADPRGSDAYNMQLSEARVKKVADELQKRNPNTRISIDWKGEREPIKPSALPFSPTETELLAMDRRVELVLPNE